MSETIEPTSGVQGTNPPVTEEVVSPTATTGASTTTATTFDGTVAGLQKTAPEVWRALLEAFGIQVVRRLNSFQERSLQRQKEYNRQSNRR